MSDVGSRIKDVRVQAGQTQQDFAAKIGMSPSYLSELERGLKNSVGSEFLVALKRIYGVSADWILEGELPLYTAGDFVGRVSEPTTGHRLADGDYDGEKLRECESRVEVLTRENEQLKGQIIAYKDIIQSTRT